MLITPKKFLRKPFEVEAVEVTAENIEDVARWCRGQMRKSVGPAGRNVQRYIKVNVKRPLNERQTMAYVGDWVVAATDQNIRGFKVYTPKAFSQSFNETVEHMFETLERMDNRANEEEKVEQEESLFPEELHFSSRS